MIAVHCEECDCWVNNNDAYDIMWTLASPCDESHVYHFCCLPCLQKWVKDDLLTQAAEDGYDGP